MGKLSDLLYLAQVKQDVAEREAADWLKTEEAKLPPLKYGIGDPFTIYSEAGTKEIVLTSITDGDVFYIYPDEPGQGHVFMDREAFEHSLRTGHIRDAQLKERYRRPPAILTAMRPSLYSSILTGSSTTTMGTMSRAVPPRQRLAALHAHSIMSEKMLYTSWY